MQLTEALKRWGFELEDDTYLSDVEYNLFNLAPLMRIAINCHARVQILGNGESVRALVVDP